MADNFSLDDILAEIDAKKASKGEDDKKDRRKKSDLSVTSIINDDELNAALSGVKGGSESKSEYSVTSIINSTGRKKSNEALGSAVSGKEEAKAVTAEPKPAKEEKAQTAPKDSPKAEKVVEDPVKAEKKEPAPQKAEKTETKPAAESKPVEAAAKPAEAAKGSVKETAKDTAKEAAKEKRKPKSDFFAAFARKLSDPSDRDNIKEKTGKSGDELAFPDEEEKAAADNAQSFAESKDGAKADGKDTGKTESKSENKGGIKDGKSEDKNEIRNEVQDIKAQEEEKSKKPIRRPEYDTAQRKLIDRQLKAEEELENPEEMIDSLNPLEVRSKAQEMNATAENTIDFDVSGSTQGIAGNELKELAEKSASPKAFDEKVKLYQTSTDLGSLMPNALSEEKPKKAPVSDSPTVETAPAANSPTVETVPAVKEYIPQKEKEKAEKAQKAQNNLSEKEKRSNEALLEKLNIALTKQHKKDEEKRKTLGLSGPVGTSDALKTPTHGLNLNKDKIIQATGVIPDIEAEAKESSKRKLRDFMMDSENEEESEQEDDFDSYDSTGQIWSDLCESHKVIKLRLVLLLVLAVFMGFVALMGDLNNGMVFKLFGSNVTFLDRRADVQGFLFYSLIAGVVASGICGSVLSGGLIKLFKLKADCDSVCAITTVISLIVTVINIADSDAVLLSYAFVLIPTAIAGLMFNTLGKLMMITRAKRNFRFISGDSAKYSALLVDEQPASALTRGVVNELPCLAAIRKTELLTDFLKSSYCEDKADRISRKLVPISLGAALFAAVIAYVIPYGYEGMNYNIYYALSVFTAVLTAASPFSIMFVVNAPLTKAGKSLAKSDSVILGYQAAEDFSRVNSVMVDASLLFPPGTVIYTNIKHYKQPNSVQNIALDQAIILAASLAIKSGSVMSPMFRNMINDKEDILVKVENCVYEDNLGVLGWYGNKRMMLGGREQMKRHDIKLPDMKKYNKYVTDSTETIFLSVGGEIVIMFFVELLANQEVKNSLQQLAQNDVSVVIKTTDSMVTVSKIAEVFEIPPENIKVLPYSMHEQFNNFTHYVPKGSGAVSCGGTFTGFSKAIIAAKKLIKDIGVGCWTMVIGSILGAVLSAAAAWSGNTQLLCPSILTAWNTAWLIAAAAVESIRRY